MDRQAADVLRLSGVVSMEAGWAAKTPEPFPLGVAAGFDVLGVERLVQHRPGTSRGAGVKHFGRGGTLSPS